MSATTVPSTAATPPVQRAKRWPPAAGALAALAGAGLVGTAACADDMRLLALAATLLGPAALLPVFRGNRPTLAAALLLGAAPAALSLRAHPFPRYDAAFTGVLLVLAAECANRAHHVHSTAPRAVFGRWIGPLAVVLAAGAAATAVVMLAARGRLSGAVVLTLLGAAALATAGLAVSRAAHR